MCTAGPTYEDSVAIIGTIAELGTVSISEKTSFRKIS